MFAGALAAAKDAARRGFLAPRRLASLSLAPRFARHTKRLRSTRKSHEVSRCPDSGIGNFVGSERSRPGGGSASKAKVLLGCHLTRGRLEVGDLYRVGRGCSVEAASLRISQLKARSAFVWHCQLEFKKTRTLVEVWGNMHEAPVCAEVDPRCASAIRSCFDPSSCPNATASWWEAQPRPPVTLAS